MSPAATRVPGTALPQLLCARGATGASGIVSATRGKLKRLFCLNGGRLAFATSNVIEEQIHEHLLARNVIDKATRDAAVEDAARLGRKVTDILLALPRPGEEALRLGMEGLVRQLLTATIDWPDGSYVFEAGLPQVDSELTVDLAPAALVLAVAREHPPRLDTLRSRLGKLPRMAPADGADTILGAAELDATVRYLMGRLDGRTDLASLTRESPEAEEPILRALWGLFLAGAVAPRATAVPAKARDWRDVPLTRDECLKQLKAASSEDHYIVLGVGRDCTVDQVRDAYYGLARRYHPDRFRSGDLADLLPRFEGFFSLVTSAYNTLSDYERRREYDRSAAERAAEAGAPKVSETGYLARQNFLRGRALAAQRRYNEALTFLENAVRMDGTQAEYHRELGFLLARNPRRRRDAERHLITAAEIAPANARTYVVLGEIYMRASFPALAARMFREALRWEPGHVDASTRLAETGLTGDEPTEGEFLEAILQD